MSTVGFLNLPSWMVELRQFLLEQGQTDLVRAPVLGGEDVERPWAALAPDEFFACVETGLHFPDGRSPVVDRWPARVITADAALASRRWRLRQQATTGVRGAIGGTFPLLDLHHPRAGYPAPRRLLAAPDGVAVAALTEMEHTGRTLEAALQDIQWRNLAPGNATRHLHGLVARDRLALLAGLLFGVDVDPDAIPCEGLTRITPRDVELATRLDMTIRLLAAAELGDGGLSLWVRPVLLPARYLLAQIRSGSEGAYLQRADQSSVFYSGPATGPAVILRGMIRDWLEPVPMAAPAPTPPAGSATTESGRSAAGMVEGATSPASFFLRFALSHFDLTVAQVLNVLAAKGIGIRSLYQPENGGRGPLPDNAGHSEPELVVFTRPVEERHLSEALREIRDQIKLATVKTCLRTEG
ncbi:MAG: Homoserine dehydrogenase [Candidatus Ozemobacter sibiricus]|jgi:homoserine dehydrogenase|uniref:Homoserine dehydrogenase n=1 Tax=Candidatus Ozemobacter sibiricus TaxID=2268124 RepID=A0A367ZLI6_9BACT|nr:MAG: Homoserine dehydrogenase [Candidatus Ozemobacter sibiricus]